MANKFRQKINETTYIEWTEGSHYAKVMVYDKETNCFSFAWSKDSAEFDDLVPAMEQYLDLENS